MAKHVGIYGQFWEELIYYLKDSVHTLKDHCFAVYRLNRFHDFVQKSQEKAGNWIGYDFSGMFGVWNSNLRPNDAKAIGHDYICSTIVAAALYYAGDDMKVSGRGGWLDLVSPRQVVTSPAIFVS